MADPLKLLREYIINNRPVKEKDNYIVFGDTAFQKLAKTNHLVWSKKDEYYTLESLFFFYKKRALAHTAYVKEAAAKNIQVVTRADRKGLEDYLTKEKLDSNFKPNIDHSAPIPTSIHISRLQTSSANASANESHFDGQPDAKRARIDDKDQARKEQERILQILDGNTRPQTSKPENIRDLSKEMGLTADKVADLRAKALARKQKFIKSTEDDFGSGTNVDGSAAGSVADSRRYVDSAQAEVTREIAKRERQWKTRTTCMEAVSKNFAKNILPVLQTIKAREDGRHTTTAETSASSRPSTSDPLYKQNPMMARSLTNQQVQGYNRYDQERFRKEETEGFKIDTMGTYHGITLKSITEGAKPKQQTPQAAPKPGSMSITPLSGHTPISGDDSSSNRPQKRISRTPIIIIPAAGNSLITMYNASDLLQELRYISTDEKKTQGARSNEVLIQRRKEGNLTVPYRIIDNPLKLTQEEWDRVVAVFVQGPAWQFKGWPWNGNPVEIFQQIAAFHLKWDDVKPDANVAKWAVNIIELSRNKRHLDRACLLKFWDILGRYMMKHKQYLRH